MKYPNLFKSRYPNLQGRDWINNIEPEDRQAFIEIGLSATNFGKTGGNATVEKYGREHMKNIGRIGAIVLHIRREWKQAVEAETLRLGGTTTDI